MLAQTAGADLKPQGFTSAESCSRLERPALALALR